MYVSMQSADAYDSKYACSRSKAVQWKHTSCSRSDQQIHGACRQATELSEHEITTGHRTISEQIKVLSEQNWRGKDTSSESINYAQ